MPDGVEKEHDSWTAFQKARRDPLGEFQTVDTQMGNNVESWNSIYFDQGAVTYQTLMPASLCHETYFPPVLTEQRERGQRRCEKDRIVKL